MYHQLPQTACIKPCRRQISQNDIFDMTERSQRVLEYTDQFLIIYFLFVVLTSEVSKTNIIVKNHIRRMPSGLFIPMMPTLT